MKSIILFRHGKSNWTADYVSDHDRPIAQRGILAAKKMGLHLSKNNLVPDKVVSSTARRAKETAKIAIKEGSWDRTLNFDESIYGGDVDDLVRIARSQNEQHLTLCLIGHEPTFSTFIAYSTNSEYIHFPTASMAKIDFKVNKWAEIKIGNGKLDWLLKPKKI